MENIFQLLSQYDFTIINQNINEFKCAICQTILINACQVFCGCRFCRNCADARVIAGDMFCPGNTEECKTANLSNVLTDHRVNRQISQLVAKCPEKTCSYECSLRNMDEHLRFCEKKSVACPFHDVGCDEVTFAGDRLNEHLQMESRRHSEILINIIGNLKNEMAELKGNGERYNGKIDELEKNDREKAAIIETLSDEMKSMNEEIKSLKLDKVVLEQRVVELMDTKMDKRDAARQIDIVTGIAVREKHERTMMEIDTRLGEMRKECRDVPQLALPDNGKGINKCRTGLADKVGGVQKSLVPKIDRGFVWTIDGIEKNKGKKDEGISSEYFNGCAERYKMCLGYRWWLYDNQVWIRLGIDAGESDKNLQWPFDRNVTITITNQNSPNARKVMSQRCKIAKPKENSSSHSERFIFNRSDLFNEGLLIGDRFTVQCIIDDK